MKSKFIAKSKKLKKKLIIELIFIILMITIGITISYKAILKSNIKIDNKDFVNILVNNSYSNHENILEEIYNKTLEYSDPIKHLNYEYNKYLPKVEKVVNNNTSNDEIYIYNTHQTEEYQTTNYIDFTLQPTVMINDYIMEDIFEKNGYGTLVEEASIKDILNNNNWKYADSYKASRVLLEESIIKNPNLKYFIDVHRDSLEKNKTSISIDDKEYAKILFIVGLENENYEANLEFTEKINNKLNEYYPNLSKGIYKKSGPGVNGIYNQDFSKYTILIEIGGYENTTTEVLNSSIAFSRCFLEVINEKYN